MDEEYQRMAANSIVMRRFDGQAWQHPLRPENAQRALKPEAP